MTAPIRIGMISYNNAAPFRSVEPAFAAEWHRGVPAELSYAMAHEELDVCLLPTAAYAHLRDVDLIASCDGGAFGIGARGRVLSVLLFSEQPIAEVIGDDRPIYVTPQSTTTRALLSQLCLHEFGRRPVITDDRTRAQTRLLIGDEAMDETLAEHDWPIVIDMAQWWFEIMDLPFVFAIWAARRGIDEDRLAAVARWLTTGLAAATTKPGRATLRRLGRGAGWSSARSDLYFHRLRYRLGPQDLAGMRTFMAMLKEDEHV